MYDLLELFLESKIVVQITIVLKFNLDSKNDLVKTHHN